jgi:two-component system chemotaxis response regulator CheY
MSYDLKNVSVLLAEDINMMQELIGFALNSLGIKTIYKANDGVSAYELYKVYNPDVVMCDWQMSPGTGLDLVEKIRKDKSSFTRTVPIIMITGYASEEYVKTARDAGVNEFLVKPFTAESLAARLASIIERPKSFVETANYFGPDRRRRIARNVYEGPKRRSDDIEELDSWSVDI